MARTDLDLDRVAEESERLSARLLHHGKALVGALDIGPGEGVLDVGCGTGQLAEFVARIVGFRGRVVGIDPLTFRINIARQRSLPNFIARSGRAEDLYAFKRESLDVVLMNSIFHWIQRREQALTEAARVLRPGGRIGISTLAKKRPDVWQAVLEKVFGPEQLGGGKSGTWGSPHRIDIDQLYRLLTRAGFEGIKVGIRTFVDHFRDVDEVIEFEFGALNAHGYPPENFFARLPIERRAAARAALARELETHVTQSGIRLDRHLIFAIAYKAK